MSKEKDWSLTNKGITMSCTKKQFRYYPEEVVIKCRDMILDDIKFEISNLNTGEVEFEDIFKIIKKRFGDLE